MRHLPRAALVTLLAIPGTARSGDREAAKPLPKATTVWGIAGSIGIPTGDRSTLFGSAMFELDRVVSEPGGPGFLRGQLGFGVEIIPVFLLSEGPTAYGAGFNLMGRHYFETSGRWRPFASLGAGLIVSNAEIPVGVSELNFTPQAGFGFLIPDRHQNVYSIEVRFHHLSNGGRVSPNPGINSILVQFGVHFRGLGAVAVEKQSSPTFQ